MRVSHQSPARKGVMPSVSKIIIEASGTQGPTSEKEYSLIGQVLRLIHFIESDSEFQYSKGKFLEWTIKTVHSQRDRYGKWLQLAQAQCTVRYMVPVNALVAEGGGTRKEIISIPVTEVSAILVNETQKGDWEYNWHGRFQLGDEQSKGIMSALIEGKFDGRHYQCNRLPRLGPETLGIE